MTANTPYVRATQLTENTSLHNICYGKPPSPDSGSAESKMSRKLQKTTMAKDEERSGFISRSRKLT